VVKPNTTPVHAYLAAVEKLVATGVAREHAYRPALSGLLHALLPNMTPVNEPAQVECGAPDFAIIAADIPVGHVEAKDLGADLDKLLRGEQLQRYLAGLPNFIFTNQLDFIWFVDGVERTRVSIATWTKAKRISRRPDAYSDFEAMFAEFGATSTKQIKHASALAERLASVATLIRSAVSLRLKLTKKGALHDQLSFFRKILSLNIDAESFADIYAQTIAYGLFTARSFHDGTKPFTRHLAAYELPKSNPFLRSIYAQLAGPDMEPSLVWAVDHLARILDRTDMPTVLAEFAGKSGKNDPVFYFYEDFLAHYDPALKEARGVYYTPESVVDYMVRSVDELLVSSFGLKSGLADRSKIQLEDGAESHRVVVLDPAAGTGTFLASVIDRIRNIEIRQGRGGNWNAYVREHLIPRILGLELLMAPYTVCHLKLGLMLEKSGFKFKDDERIGVYLTNSLEEPQVLMESSPFTKALHEEGAAAGRLKGAAPVMVVLGNPPYSGHSANSGEFLKKLLHGSDILSGEDAESYFHVDGVSIGERQPKWLNDDYVKFIRFSQWKIERNGSGILAFITNHNYLSAPTFRAMRASLLNTFDDIFVLDLHGSTKRRDVAEDGSVDQNVFDIMQGVAIVIFVKRGSELSDGVNRVHYQSLRGPRSSPAGSNVPGKYAWLATNSVATTNWQSVEPLAPYFLFVPRSKTLSEEYEKGISLKMLFHNSGVGIVAGRDHFNFAFTKAEMEGRLVEFMSMSDDEARERFELGKDSTAWSVRNARKDIAKHGRVDELVKPAAYRPFDRRFTYYTGDSNGFLARPTPKVNRPMADGPNLALCTARSVEVSSGWSHVFAVDSMVQHHAVSTKEVNHIFPLWTYSEVMGQMSKRHNLQSAAIAHIAERLGIPFEEGASGRKDAFGEQDVFEYSLAVLHSAEYRLRYAEPLRDDYARIPFTSDLDLYSRLRQVGADILAIELLQSEDSGPGTFPINGSNEVTAQKIVVDGEGRVWINDDQYFAGVDEQMKTFSIGGIKVVTQWLSDRRGRMLTTDDVTTYLSILNAASNLTDLPAAIDEIIEGKGGWPLP
jgi:hypothetical protein